jgi:hypothetical protein
VNSKSGERVSGIKPLRTPLLHRINQVIVEKETLLALAELNPATTQEKYYHSGGVVSNERNNETRRWKGGFQGRFRRDEKTQTSESTPFGVK